MDNPHKCGFLNLSKCYDRVIDKYDSTNPTVWKDVVVTGFVLKVKEKK